MKWHATGVDYHISDTTNSYLEDKFQRLEHMKGLLEEIKITIIKDTHEFRVEAQTHFKWGGSIIHVENKMRDLWPAIDHLFDSLDIKLSKEKSKYQEIHRDHLTPNDQE